MAYQHTTLATLKQRLKEKIGNSNSFWVPDEAADAINEGICYWHGLTGEWTEVRNLTANGSHIYTLPSQCASVLRVSYVSNINSFGPGTALSQTTLSELDKGFPNWQTAPGNPEQWAPEGLNFMAIYPQPTVGYFAIESIKEAPTLFSDPDYIDIGEEELTYILGYAQWYLAFKEGIKEATDNVQPLLQRMVEAAILRNKRLKESAFYRTFMGEHRDEEFRPGRAVDAGKGVRVEAFDGKK